MMYKVIMRDKSTGEANSIGLAYDLEEAHLIMSQWKEDKHINQGRYEYSIKSMEERK